MEKQILLPPELSGRQVTGAKFQDGYLITALLNFMEYSEILKTFAQQQL